MEKIKELRDLTGAGIVECKKALMESNGDITEAVEILRKKGISKAAKRSDREAREGIIKTATNSENNEGYIAMFNAETDFVVRSEKFQEFSNKVFNIIRDKKVENYESLMSEKLDNFTIKESLDNLSGVIGEKIEIKKFEIIKSSGTVSSYSHMGGRIGVLVSLNMPNKSDLAREIAMQIAAVNPKYLIPAEIPQEELNKEKEIYREQLIKEGKNEKIIEKIIEGKINKFYEEVCLLNQEYIKDDTKKIKDLLGDSVIEKFVRYSL